MDSDDRRYLDEFKQDIKDSLKAIEQHIKELIETSIKPIEKQSDKHSVDISELYTFDRESRERCGGLESRIKILEDDKQESRFSHEMKVVIGIAVASILVSVILSAVTLFVG